MREEYDPLNASFPAHLSIFSHFDFVSLEAETQNIVFRLLKAESEVFDVDILTPMMSNLNPSCIELELGLGFDNTISQPLL